MIRKDHGVRLLVLGGTAFVGRAIVEAALAGGADVTRWPARTAAYGDRATIGRPGCPPAARGDRRGRAGLGPGARPAAATPSPGSPSADS